MVGIHKVLPCPISIIKAGEEGSHAVYPRASNVARKPPLGKEDASGSCWINASPSNCSIAVPSPLIVKNESCFSAVLPVNGWNQWVKCVTPLLSAHVLIPLAIWLAIALSIFCPALIEEVRLLKASSLKNFLAVFCVKTFSPNIAVISAAPSTFTSGSVLRLLIALKRSDMIVFFILSKEFQN